MALDDMFKGNLGTGLMFGLGAAVVAPIAIKVLRPAAKAVIKGGMSLYEDSGIGDAVGDLTSEARAERDKARRDDEGEQGEADGSRPKKNMPQPA